MAKVEEALAALKDSDDLTAIKVAQTQAQHLVNQLTQDQTKLRNRLIDLKQQLQTLKDKEQKLRAALAQTSQDQANRQGLEKHLTELHKRQKTLEQDRDNLNQTLTDLRAKQDRLAELCLPSVTRELRQTPTGVAVYEVTMVNGKWQSEKQVDFHYNSLRTEDTAFVTRYQADTSLTAGQTRVKETGQVGRREAGVIYTVKDGQLVTTSIDRVLTEAVPELILVGTKPVITTEPIVYLTSYQADDSLEKGKEIIAQAGVLGEKTMTISYALDTMSGQVTANQPTEAITLKPTAELIRVGSQPTTVSKELAFGTVYQADDRLEVGETKVATLGKVGQETLTTSYQLVDNSKPDLVVVETVRQVTPATTQVMLVGTKPHIKQTELAFSTQHTIDPSLKVGETVIKQAGQPGLEQVTTSYTLDVVTGKLTASTKTDLLRQPVVQVVAMGPTEIFNEELDYAIDYIEDSTLPALTEVVQTAGQKGRVTYALIDGVKVELERVEPVNELVRLGTSVAALVEEQEPEAEILPFTTRYVDDASLPLGQEVVQQEGKEGFRSFVTTAEGRVYLETQSPIERIVRVGTRK